ncbi:MAG: translocation/assembly module TamB domain-containing protein [Deltaproteobacteria bacterium]|nr:translocation/assembly module TamB domain-containing protein [Deltaproteobacteria bacterium]
MRALRKVAKVFVFAAGGLMFATLAFLVFVFFFLQSAAGGRFVGRTVQGILKDKLGIEAKIGAIRVNFFRTAVTLLDLSLSDGKNPPIGSIDMVYVELSPIHLLRNKVVIKDVVVERPAGHIVMKDGEIVNLPKLPSAEKKKEEPPPKAGPGMEVEVMSASIRKGRAKFEIPGRLDVDLRGFELSAKRQPGFYDITLETEPFAVTSGTEEFRDIRVALKGWLAEDGADVKDLEVLIGKEGFVKAKGAVRGFAAPAVDAEVSLSLPLELMKRTGLGLPDASGRVTLQAKAKGAIPAVEASGSLTVEKGRFEEFNIGDVAGHFSYGKNRAEVKNLTVKNQGVHVGIDAGITLEGDFPVEGEVQIAHLEVHRLLENIGVKDLPLTLTAAGKVKLSGQVMGDLRFFIHPDLHITDLAVLKESWRRKSAGPPTFALKAMRFSADAELTPRGMTLSRGRIGIDDSTLVIDGSRFMFDANEGMYLKASSESFSLSSISPVAGINMGGTGPISTEVKGPYPRLEIGADVRFAGLQVMGLSPGDLGASVRIKDNKLTATDVNGRRGKFKYTASATVDFGKAVTIAADFATQDAPLQDILGILNLKGVDLSPFAGTVAVNAHVEGPPDALSGRASLAVTGIKAMEQKIDRVDLAATLSEGDVKVDKLVVALNGARVTAEGTMSKKGFLNFSARTEKLKLSHIAYANVKAFPVDSAVELKASVGGTVAAPAIEAHVSMTETVLGKQTLPPSYIDVTMKEQDVAASLNMFGGTLLASAKANLKGRQPFSLSAEIKKLPYARLIPGGEAMKGTLEADINLAGQLTDPMNSAGEVRLKAVDFGMSDMKFELKKPTTVTLRSGAVTMDPIVIGGEGIELVVSSGQVARGMVDLAAEATADLGVLDALAKDAVTADGKVVVKANVSGKLDKLDISGMVSLDGGRFKIHAVPQHPVEDVVLQASVTRSKVQIDELRAKMADGQIRGSGEVELDNFAPKTFRLGVDLHGMALKFPKEFPSRFSGKVTVEGDPSSILIGGNIHVEEARYTEPLDWNKVLASLKKKGVKAAPQFDKEKEILQLDLGVKADSNIIIKNDLLDAELKADIRVTGSAQRIGVVGTVSTIRAKAQILSHEYDVKRALVQLRERHRIAYNLEVQADTSCQDATTGAEHPIRVDISGVDGDFKMNFRDSGSPAYDEVKIFGCLAEMSKIDIKDMVPVSIAQLDKFRVGTGYSQLSKTTVPMVQVGWKLTPYMRLEYVTSVVDSNDQKIDLEYKLNRVTTLRGRWGRNAQVPMGDIGTDLRLRWEY